MAAKKKTRKGAKASEENKPAQQLARTPEAFQALETEVIAPLVRAKEPDAPLRVWSVGSATGEEAYSLGIVLQEQPEATTTAIRNFLSGPIFPDK